MIASNDLVIGILHNVIHRLHHRIKVQWRCTALNHFLVRRIRLLSRLDLIQRRVAAREDYWPCELGLKVLLRFLIDAATLTLGNGRIVVVSASQHATRQRIVRGW